MGHNEVNSGDATMMESGCQACGDIFVLPTWVLPTPESFGGECFARWINGVVIRHDWSLFLFADCSLRTWNVRVAVALYESCKTGSLDHSVQNKDNDCQSLGYYYS